MGRTRSANIFPLYNQSPVLESLKDQLGFLVTIILGGDSLIHKNKKKLEINRGSLCSAARVQQHVNSSGSCYVLGNPLGSIMAVSNSNRDRLGNIKDSGCIFDGKPGCKQPG